MYIRTIQVSILLSFILTLSSVFIAISPAQAATDEALCLADRLKLAAKFDFCIMNAEAKAIKKGGAPDVSKCEEKRAKTWSKIVAKYAAALGSNPCRFHDESSVTQFMSQQTQHMINAVNAGP